LLVLRFQPEGQAPGSPPLTPELVGCQRSVYSTWRGSGSRTALATAGISRAAVSLRARRMQG